MTLDDLRATADVTYPTSGRVLFNYTPVDSDRWQVISSNYAHIVRVEGPTLSTPGYFEIVTFVGNEARQLAEEFALAQNAKRAQASR